MTTANSMRYLQTAYETVEHTYARNNLLVEEAKSVKANIDLSARHEFSGTMLSDTAEEMLDEHSMNQRQNRILELSREIVKVRDWNKTLTRCIEDKVYSDDDQQPASDIDDGQAEQVRRSELPETQEPRSSTISADAERPMSTVPKPAKGSCNLL